MTNGIYKIEHKESGAIYIGQSKNIERRWKQHHKRFPTNQYDYMIILEVPLEHDLNLLEKLFIEVYDSHKNGLNRTIGGTSIRSRYFHEETRKKIGDSLKGNQRRLGKPHTKEAKRRISEAQSGEGNGNYGKPISDEHKAAISLAQRGNKHTLGRTASEETKQRMSEAHKGRRHSEETKQRMSEARKGKLYTEEARLRMAEATRNAPKHTCPYCGKESAISNYSRWHGDNCKSKPKTDTEVN